ncbi:hypothetical protein CFB3_05140 [Clostridium folliculivorans]|nr:hypothetical protein CFB3_05140 [Clostridium folliculivorans]
MINEYANMKENEKKVLVKLHKLWYNRDKVYVFIMNMQFIKKNHA